MYRDKNYIGIIYGRGYIRVGAHMCTRRHARTHEGDGSVGEEILG